MTQRIYLENPYLKDLNARVRKKEYSNGKFYITLNRTIFYPHMSGGQPRDKGTINDTKVLDVFEENGEIIHVLEDNIDENVRLSIDWSTRFDHMQQHTGQHILSSAFLKLYNAETIGFHLGKEYVYIDVKLPHLNEGDVNKIERYANEIVFSNFAIKNYIINKNEISKLPLRKVPSVDANIRIVEIDGIDFSPCGGTHHRSTGEVGMVKIRKWLKYKGNIRVEFVCGNRALADYSWKNSQINSISNLLSVKDKNCFKGVEKLYNDNKSLIKNIQTLKDEINRYKAMELLNSSYNINGTKLVYKVFENSDFKDMKYLSSSLLNNEKIVVLFGMKENEKAQVIMGRSRDININMKGIFDSSIGIIGGRGGGSSQLVQGGGPKPEKIEECLKTAFNLIKNKIEGA